MNPKFLMMKKLILFPFLIFLFNSFVFSQAFKTPDLNFFDELIGNWELAEITYDYMNKDSLPDRDWSLL